MSLMIFEFKPIAAMARTIKNLLNSLTGRKKLGETPKLVAMVVIIEAAKKNKMKKGNIFFMLIFLAPDCFNFLA